MIGRGLLLAALFVAGCREIVPRDVPPHVAPLADAARVAGQPPAVVDAVLGPPLGGPVQYDGWVHYANGVSVRYHAGRAELIQSAALAEYRYGPAVLRLFGVAGPPPPSIVERRMMRWNAGVIPPFAAVTLHTHERLHGGTDYVNFFAAGFPVDSVF